MFNRMRIRTKLLLGFAAVALIAVGIGVFGVVQIRKIERADTQLYQNVAVPLGYTTDIVSYFQRIRVNIRDVMLARNETEFKNYYDRIKQHDEALDRTIALYEATLKDEADRQNYQNILKAKKSYMDYLPEYMDKLNAKDMEGALTHLRGDWIKANNAMQEAVDAVVAYNIDAGKKFAEANSAIAKASNNIMLIFAVAAAVLAFLLGVLISGNIKSIINSLIKTTRELVDAAVAGRLSTRGDSEAINFEFREIIVGFNKTLDAVIGPLNVAAEYVDRISKGNIPPKITDSYNGDFNEIKNNLNVCIDAVNLLIADANMLAKAAMEGKLATRADSSRHQGDFGKVVDGVNDTLNTLVGFIDAMPAPAMAIDADFTINYINDIGAKIGHKTSKQLIGTKCYDHFRTGDCRTGKCACANSMMSGLSTNSETEANPAGQKLDIYYSAVPIKDKAGKTIGAFEIVTDQTQVKQAVRKANKIAAYQQFEAERLTANLQKMSLGDLNLRIATEAADEDTRASREIFENINAALDKSVRAIGELTNDAKFLAQAALEGKLATRVDATKHQGEYRSIIEGVNRTLDAVIGPLNVAAEYIDRISKGDMPNLITDSYQGDFNNIKNNLNLLINALNNITEKAKMIANGDLTVELNPRSDRDELMRSLQEMVKSVSGVVEQVQNSAENIAAASLELSSTAQQISQGANEQASATEEVSSAMEQMSSNIQQNKENAQQTEKISTAAAEGMGKVAASAQESLNSIKMIAEKISIISDIAFQTNILALNAAVEAARAGEHGRGFAVVAAEVRKLAERSKVAAEEINVLSKTSVEVTEESGRMVMAIIPEVERTARLVQEITAASIEQDSGSSQINNAITQLSQVTQQNSAGAEEMASSTEELTSQSEQLKELVGFFKLDGQMAKGRVSNTKFSKDYSKQVISHAHYEKGKVKGFKSRGVVLDLHGDNGDKESGYETY